MNQTKSIVFLGAPRAGKTVFVATAVGRFRTIRHPPFHDHSLREKIGKAIRGIAILPAVKLSPNGMKSETYIQGLLSRLERGSWAEPTQGIERRKVDVTVQRHLATELRLAELVDCSGDLFLRTFARKPRGTEEHQVLQCITNAYAVVVTVDPASLHSDVRGSEPQIAFVEALTYIPLMNKKAKIAIVFTKSDLYDNLPADLLYQKEQTVSGLVPGWKKHHQRRRRLFSACCVRAEINMEGRPSPPNRWSPENSEGIDEVIWWLMDGL